MELTIYRRGAAAGALRIEDDGLYRRLSARLDPGGQILRLYLDGVSFGVFCPEDGALVLRTRVSRARLPVLPDRAVAWCPADGVWMPSGDGLLRFTPRGAVRAIRWRTDGPMDLPAAPGRLRILPREDGYWLYDPEGDQ